MKSIATLLFAILCSGVAVGADPPINYDPFGNDDVVEWVQVCEGGVCRMVPVQRAVNVVEAVASRVASPPVGAYASFAADDVCSCGCGMSGCNCQGGTAVRASAAILGRTRVFTRSAISRPFQISRNVSCRARNFTRSILQRLRR